MNREEIRTALIGATDEELNELAMTVQDEWEAFLDDVSYASPDELRYAADIREALAWLYAAGEQPRTPQEIRDEALANRISAPVAGVLLDCLTEVKELGRLFPKETDA